MRYRPFGRSGLALSTLGLHLPAHVLTVRLVALGEGRERTIGEYRLNHSPWAA